jgi:competence protein ComEA
MRTWLERNRVAVVSILGVFFVGSVALLLLRLPRPGPIIISTPQPTVSPTIQLTPTPAPLRVYVSGAVQSPDVYVLPPGSIVKDALAAAGGATDDADLARINLAILVQDQQQIHVPREGEADPPVPPPGRSSSADLSTPDKIDLNTASAAELDALPGIGPAIAQRIVDYREANGRFAAIEDIVNVKGIGPATFEQLKDLIVVR